MGPPMKRLLCLGLLCALAAPSLAAEPKPLTLAETRPLETALGNPAILPTPAVWLDMIHSAKSSLDLEEYYLSERRGEALSPVLQAIGEAAARGVKVRLLLDSGMHRTYPMPADSLGRLANLQVRTVDYHRLAGGVQHSKFMVVDAREAFIGSQNLDWRSLAHIHELGARVELPPVAAALEDVFESDWQASDTTHNGPPVDRARVSWPLEFRQDGVAGRLWLAASPRATTPASILWDRDLLVQRIDEARHEIVVQTLTYGRSGFGFTDSTLHRALVAAAGRGVHVRLLVSDWEIGSRTEGDLKELAAVPNVEVRISRVPEWSGGYIPYARVEHCKFAVMDSTWLWLGTSNWEPSYFLSTRNVALIIQHAGIAGEARRSFESDWNAPTAERYAPDTQLVAKPHGPHAPPGARVYGE